MRRLIERLETLTEATFNLDKDVEMIFRKSGVWMVAKAIQTGEADEIERALKPWIRGKGWQISSDRLVTRDGKKAHSEKPVSILVTMSRTGSSYDPRANEVVISLHNGVARMMDQMGYQVAQIQAMLPKSQRVAFVRELDEDSIRGTIYHELSHWVDDALHGKHLTAKMQRAAETNLPASGDHTTVNQTYFELNAQVHAIKAIRKRLGKREYDKLSWAELFSMKSSLLSNFGGIPSGEYRKVMKNFARRLHREGLLGKGLKALPSHDEMQRLNRRD